MLITDQKQVAPALPGSCRCNEPEGLPVMQLQAYQSGSYHPGASRLKQLLWYYLGSPLLQSRLLPFSILKVEVLRLFGASMGQGIRIKPGVRVKFPWRLTVGDHCWIGEDAWIDNLAPVVIEDNVCLSQDTYLCTGNHDWSRVSFDLKLAPIRLCSGSWVGARASVAPGVTVGRGAILTLGSVAHRDLESMRVYGGNPAKAKTTRKLQKN